MKKRKPKRPKPLLAEPIRVSASDTMAANQEWFAAVEIKRRWKALSSFKRHWFTNIALGFLIELFVHIGGHTFHWSPIVGFQNWGLDVVTRLNATACSWSEPEGQTISQLNKVLKCPEADQPDLMPILVDIDAQTWRDPNWGGGEPYRAPREKLLALIDQSFKLGAKQVVLDVVIEDGATPDPLRLEPSDIRKLAQKEDQIFADGLRALLLRNEGRDKADGYFGAYRKLILVRTLRNPLPFKSDTDAFLGELRTSAAVDVVIAQAAGRIVVAAPYFHESTDRVTRDWDLFKIVCERLPGTVDTGVLRAVPSVQLASISQLQRSESLTNEIFTNQSKAPDRACAPYPQLHPSALPEGDSLAQACLHAIEVEGGIEAVQGDVCKKAKGACQAVKDTSEYGNFKVCPTLLDRQDAIERKAPQGWNLFWQLAFGHRTSDGFSQEYWSKVQSEGGAQGKLGELPRQGDLSNRIVFRYTTDQVKAAVTTVGAKRLLADPGSQSFAGRTVVIGQTYQETGDFFRTPLGKMPGAVVLVNAMDSMARHRLMQPPSTLQTLSVAFVLIVVVGFLFARWDSAVGSTIAVLVVVLTAGVASFFYFAHGVWFDFAAPIFGIHLHRRFAAMEERMELKRLTRLHGQQH